MSWWNNECELRSCTYRASNTVIGKAELGNEAGLYGAPAFAPLLFADLALLALLAFWALVRVPSRRPATV